MESVEVILSITRLIDQYDNFVPLLSICIERSQQAAIETLETKVATLEAGVVSTESQQKTFDL